MACFLEDEVDERFVIPPSYDERRTIKDVALRSLLNMTSTEPQLINRLSKPYLKQGYFLIIEEQGYKIEELCSKFLPCNGYHRSINLFQGVSIPMEENRIPEWQKNFEDIVNNNKRSSRNIFMTDDEKIRFIKNCENVYGRSTREHLIIHVDKQYEGNVDERRWFRFAKELLEKNYKLDDFSR